MRHGEVWGDLTLRGTGSLAASGSQCAIHVSRALLVDGCAVDARADGAGVTGEAVAGVIAGEMAVRGGGRVVAVGAAPAAGARAYGVHLQDAGVGSAGCRLSVAASWLDAVGTDGGVGCTGGSLVSARFVAPAGGAFGAGGVVDASGAMAPHVVIGPEGATAPAGEADGREVPGGAGEPAGGAGPTVGRPGAGSATDPVLKPATTTPNTTTTTKTTVTKTAASTPSKAKTVSAAATLPKTADNNWIAASLALATGIVCIVVAIVLALSQVGNRLKASYTFPKVGAHRLTPARPYYSKKLGSLYASLQKRVNELPSIA